MTEIERFGPRDRVLVAAPHPDDEAIATGGVLQAARAAGAACRVLVVTDGDNNPWPQRWIEKRWRIDPADRVRWGARRRGEAQAALRVLGIAPDEVRCFGLPDLGLTDVLMRGVPDLPALMLEELRAFAPTRLFLPALGDRHPDHSALHVALLLALTRASGPLPQMHAFGVHGARSAASDVVLTLPEAARETKRAAIRCHATQMRLSEKRFVAYARAQEPFQRASFPGEPEREHPLQAHAAAGGVLRVAIDRTRAGRLEGQTLFVVATRRGGEPLRRLIDFSGRARNVVTDASGNSADARLSFEHAGGRIQVIVPLGGPVEAGWIKLGRREPGLFVLDRYGWQAIGAPDRE